RIRGRIPGHGDEAHGRGRDGRGRVSQRQREPAGRPRDGKAPALDRTRRGGAGRRAARLRREPDRHVPARRHLRREDLQGPPALGPADRALLDLRAHPEPEDRAAARPPGDPRAPAARQPGARMRRGRLSRKYTVALVVLVTAALVASGAFQLYSSYNENKAALVALQNEKARGAATRIETYVKEIERQLSWTTQPQLVASAAAVDQRRQDSYRLQRQVPPITELSYLDANGREQLLISRLAMDVVGSQTDYSKEAKFREAKTGKTYFSPVYFRKESEPYMTIAMPQSGGGVTVAEVNLKFIWDVVSQIKVGKAGLAYAVDRNGALIAHPDISLVLQKTTLANLAQVKAALTPGSPEVTIARDPKGREVLTSHSTITPLGWVVFIEQPLEEA